MDKCKCPYGRKSRKQVFIWVKKAEHGGEIRMTKAQKHLQSSEHALDGKGFARKTLKACD